MLKRFYSKKSGFTLVEIIVAFAVFAIMASMICQILELSVRARESNNLYAQTLANQEKILTFVDKSTAPYSDTDKTGEYYIALNGALYSLGYQVKGTNPNSSNQKEGINYFVSGVDYTCKDAGLGGGDLPGGGSSDSGLTQSSRLDSRITGSVDIDEIKIYKVVKDDYAYAEGSKFALPDNRVRYLINMRVGATNMSLEARAYSQIKLSFFYDQLDGNDSGIEYKDANDKTFTRDVYAKAKIVDVGLIDTTVDNVKTSGLSGSNTSNGNLPDGINNFYRVAKLSGNGVQISIPPGATYGFKNGNSITFYVDFEVDANHTMNNLSVSSFGANGVADGDAMIYKACPIYDDTCYTNGNPTYPTDTSGLEKFPSIYGGYLYKRNYKTTTPPATE